MSCCSGPVDAQPATLDHFDTQLTSSAVSVSMISNKIYGCLLMINVSGFSLVLLIVHDHSL